MAKVELLSSRRVETINAPGMYPDGRGLYLQALAPKTGNEQRVTKSWIYRFTMNGRTREMGFGGYPDVSLAKARAKAAKAREQVKDGIDPIDARRAGRAAAIVEKTKAIALLVTFDQCVSGYISDHEKEWRGERHRQQWERSVARYASPVIGKLPVGMVDTALVLNVLKPIWKTKPVTASLLRARIETVLDYAKVHGHRDGDNPARWRGHLDHVLSSLSKVHKVRHHTALPYQEIAEFLIELRKREATSARALEFTILTAARTNETIGARWEEIDLKAKYS